MQSGKIIFNDGVTVKTLVDDGRILEYWAREHDPALFPVGEDVDVFGCSRVGKRATQGHTFLVSDWVNEKPI